jgi:hypothetical protein
MGQEGRSPWTGPDPQVAVELPQPGAHAWDADAHPGPADRLVARRFTDAPAVVTDSHDDLPACQFRIDRNLCGPGMAMNVGQRLLHHPKNGALDLRRGVVDPAGNPDPRPQPVRPANPSMNSSSVVFSPSSARFGGWRR